MIFVSLKVDIQYYEFKLVFRLPDQFAVEKVAIPHSEIEIDQPQKPKIKA